MIKVEMEMMVQLTAQPGVQIFPLFTPQYPRASAGSPGKQTSIMNYPVLRPATLFLFDILHREIMKKRYLAQTIFHWLGLGILEHSHLP